MSGEAPVAYFLDCSLSDLEHDVQIYGLKILEEPLIVIVPTMDLLNRIRQISAEELPRNFSGLPRKYHPSTAHKHQSTFFQQLQWDIWVHDRHPQWPLSVDWLLCPRF